MLKAPFPWFGGKSRVAHLVWDRFGNVPNYVEPFAGSLAVLLGRPHAPGTETVNDKDGYLVNFWRAIKWNPASTAAWADWPVSEADLLARHKWIMGQADFIDRLRDDPAYYDCRIAGWWLWGVCSSTGNNWFRHRWNGPPHLSGNGHGIVHTQGADSAGEFLRELSKRLRSVRILHGDWLRCLSLKSVFNGELTGVFLDPPYAAEAGRDPNIYGVDDLTVAHGVRGWAIANGDNPNLRIALCGYDGEHEMPDSWECVAWKARGGYGSQGDGRGRENAARERIWFSPHCLKTPTLFGSADCAEVQPTAAAHQEALL